MVTAIHCSKLPELRPPTLPRQRRRHKNRLELIVTPTSVDTGYRVAHRIVGGLTRRNGLRLVLSGILDIYRKLVWFLRHNTLLVRLGERLEFLLRSDSGDERNAVERPRRHKRDARSQVKYTTVTVRSGSGFIPPAFAFSRAARPARQ